MRDLPLTHSAFCAMSDKSGNGASSSNKDVPCGSFVTLFRPLGDALRVA